MDKTAESSYKKLLSQIKSSKHVSGHPLSTFISMKFSNSFHIKIQINKYPLENKKHTHRKTRFFT